MEYVLGNHVYLFNIVSVLYTRLLIVEHLNFWMPCIILYHNICFMFMIALFVQYGPWSNYDSWVRSKYGGVFIEKTSHTSMLSHKCVKKSLCHRKLEHCFHYLTHIEMYWCEHNIENINNNWFVGKSLAECKSSLILERQILKQHFASEKQAYCWWQIYCNCSHLIGNAFLNCELYLLGGQWLSLQTKWVFFCLI